VRDKLTPPTIALEHLFVFIASTANCKATSELEHAVSIEIVGPLE
jgi:hypothetical protein